MKVRYLGFWFTVTALHILNDESFYVFFTTSDAEKITRDRCLIMDEEEFANNVVSNLPTGEGR